MVSMMGSIPEVSLARRDEILGLRAEPDGHEQLLGTLGFERALECVPPPADSGSAVEIPESLRVVAWNAQRCRDPEAAAALLRATGAGLFLISELDHGMARSQQRHAPRELARLLGCGYAFGVEFLELGLGDVRERETHAGEQNAAGYHGGAILCPRALVEPTLARVERSGRWFDGALGERRVGGRVAVLCRLPVGARLVTFASVHLESHSDPDERAAQLEAVFDAVDALAPGAPALVGGDVNTHSLGRAELSDRALLTRALEADPRRLAQPIPHEPLFALAERRGWDWRACNSLGTSTERRARGDDSARGTLALDWFFARGLRVSEPTVIDALDPASGAALSDHEVIAVMIRGG
jgi:hypothetical protein